MAQVKTMKLFAGQTGNGESGYLELQPPAKLASLGGKL